MGTAKGRNVGRDGDEVDIGAAVLADHLAEVDLGVSAIPRPAGSAEDTLA